MATWATQSPLPRAPEQSTLHFCWRSSTEAELATNKAMAKKSTRRPLLAGGRDPHCVHPHESYGLPWAAIHFVCIRISPQLTLVIAEAEPGQTGSVAISWSKVEQSAVAQGRV